MELPFAILTGGMTDAELDALADEAERVVREGEFWEKWEEEKLEGLLVVI